MGRPEDVAQAIAFLIGDSFISGHMLVCDGGLPSVGLSQQVEQRHPSDPMALLRRTSRTNGAGRPEAMCLSHNGT